MKNHARNFVQMDYDYDDYNGNSSNKKQRKCNETGAEMDTNERTEALERVKIIYDCVLHQAKLHEAACLDVRYFGTTNEIW